MHPSCAQIGTGASQDRVCVCMQAVPMQAYLLGMLGSGGALYELYGAVQEEPDLTDPMEMVDYTALQSAADILPALCDKSDAQCKPALNPAQLLGVSFAATPEQVSLFLVAASKLCLGCGMAAFPNQTTKEQQNEKKGNTSMHLADAYLLRGSKCSQNLVLRF